MTTAVPVIAIVGPTAVGKSTLAEDVAVALGGEIVSADSMQVYRGMDIGTAKTPPGERRVPYHCIDLVNPGTPYSAALFQRDARDAIVTIRSRGRVPVIAGGTGLYVRAALDDMRFPAGDLATPTRAALDARAASGEGAALHAELEALDPQAAALIHPNNTRRVVRALEMLAEGRSYATQAAGFSARSAFYPQTRMLGLTMDRPALYALIDRRVEEMMAAGLLAEVEALLDAGYRDAVTATQAIGYKELVPVIEQGADADAAIEAIKRASRRYAKRQLTWFRADPRIRWLDVTGLSATERTSSALRLLESTEHTG